MILDWRSVTWWDLPGPSKFLDKAAGAAAACQHGVVGLELPCPRPAGLLEALCERVREAVGDLPVRFDASAGLRDRSPVHALAAAAGAVTSGIRSVEDFLDAPDLSGAVFLIDGVPKDEWIAWGMFLRALRSELQTRKESSGFSPVVIVVLPSGMSHGDIRSTIGDKPLRWQGAVGRTDTTLLVERSLGWPGDALLERVASSVMIEMAGWDPGLARWLAKLNSTELVDPRMVLLDEFSKVERRQPTWENGLADLWDGRVHVHTAALVAARDEQELERRVWRGQVRELFPFVERVRMAFIARFDRALQARLPIKKKFHDKEYDYNVPTDLELWDVGELLKGVLPDAEWRLLAHTHIIRRAAAHFEPVDAWRVEHASHAWEDLSSSFPDDCPGWDWVRQDQKLTLLIGPSGAGKTTWAANHCDPAEVVSSDRIRGELYGESDAAGDQEPVFRKVRANAVKRLATGHSAVIDATNLRLEDRLANVSIIPNDIPVEYVVIDRPMADKRADAGWRAKKPGLLDEHARLFQEGLPDILEGDGFTNVRVRDLRIGSMRLEPVSDSQCGRGRFQETLK